MSKLKILNVGGSIIIPKTGFDIPFLKKFRAMILDRVKKGDRFILVIGGGATCRQYQDAAKQVVKMNDEELDWLGIHTTVFNANFVRFLFKDVAFEKVITDPHKKVSTNKKVLLGAGHKPGASTDIDAVFLAKTYGASELINLSNIEYVYTKDPNKFSDAQKIERIDWKTFRKDIVGNTWIPGSNAPFDPIASKHAEKLGLKVSMLKGTDLNEVKKALTGKKFRGTVIE